MPRARGLLVLPGGGQQDAHSRALVGNDADVASRVGEQDRLAWRARAVAEAGQRQRPQRLDLDDAAGPALADRGVEQPLQEGECRAGVVWASSTVATICWLPGQLLPSASFSLSCRFVLVVWYCSGSSVVITRVNCRRLISVIHVRRRREGAASHHVDRAD